MRTVIILRGVPGSGKSTFGRNLIEEAKKQQLNTKTVSADHFFNEFGEDGGEYRFDRSKLGTAHAKCFRNFIDGMQKGSDLIVVDNTNTSSIEIAPYRQGAHAYGYDVVIKTVMADPEVAFERGLHGVPISAIKRMHETLHRNLPPYWEKQEVYRSATTTSGEAIFALEVN